MNEAVISCPKCGAEIKLTEKAPLAAPLIAATRKQFEEKLSEKDGEIAQREQSVRVKEKAIADEKRSLDNQIANQVAEQLQKDRARIAAEESKKAKLAAATDLQQKTMGGADLQNVLRQRDKKGSPRRSRPK